MYKLVAGIVKFFGGRLMNLLVVQSKYWGELPRMGWSKRVK